MTHEFIIVFKFADKIYRGDEMHYSTVIILHSAVWLGVSGKTNTSK